MKKFTQLVVENVKKDRTPALFDRISDELKDIWDEQSRFLESKLAEMGFEITQAHKSIIRKATPKSEPGLHVYFKDLKGVEYILYDSLNSMEFSLHTSKDGKFGKEPDKLVQKGLYLEFVLKSLREEISNKKTIEVYFENTNDGGGHEELVEASDLFDKNKGLTLLEISKELGKRIKPLIRKGEDVFMTIKFVYNGSEYSLIGGPEGFSILNGEDDDAKDERGKKYPYINF